jgi:hypothetical protein
MKKVGVAHWPMTLFKQVVRHRMAFIKIKIDLSERFSKKHHITLLWMLFQTLCSHCTGVPQKKTSPFLPYLSEDFNYLYTKLNSCEWSTKGPNKFTYSPKGFKDKVSEYSFSNAKTYFFWNSVKDFYSEKNMYHKDTFTYKKVKKPY